MKARHLVILLTPLLLSGNVKAETLPQPQVTRSQLLQFISCNLAIGWYCARILMQAQKLPNGQS